MSKRKRNSKRLSPEVEPRRKTAGFALPELSPWAASASLVVVGWLVYGPFLACPLIFDDFTSIETNETIVSLWPLWGDESRPGPLRTPQFAPTSARPLANLSFALNYWYGKFEPTGYHAVNVWLHVGSAILLWAVIRRTLQLPFFDGRFDSVGGWLALAVALLWTVHPLQTESVIYATQRTELLMAFFYLATLYCSLRYWANVSKSAAGLRPLTPAPHLGDGPGRGVSNGALALATLACLAGMASKETMASAPLVVLLFERTFVAGSLGRALRRSWPLYCGLASGWLLVAWLVYNSPHSDSAGFHLGVPAHFWWFTQAKVLLLYLKLVVWPWPLVIHYEIPILESVQAAWPYLLALGGLGAATLILLWRNHPAGFLLTAVVAILSPTLLIPIITEVAAERRMYLPLAALAALAVVGGYELLRRNQQARPTASQQAHSPPLGGKAMAGLVLTLAIVLSLVSVRRLRAYENELAMWQEVLELQPHNYLAHQNVGRQLFMAGEVDEALAHYREAVRLKPDSSQAHYNLGFVLHKTGQLDEATHEYEEAVRLKPGSPELMNNWGTGLYTARRYDEAIRVFRDTIRLNPSMWRAHDNLGTALAASGRMSEAIASFQAALEINPLALDVYSRLADVQAKSQRPGDAVATAEKAIVVAKMTGQLPKVAKIEAQLAAFRDSQSAATAARNYPGSTNGGSAPQRGLP